MCIVQKSKNLRSNANNFLEKKSFHCLLSKYGEVVYTGSYETDLMVWPDIDIQLIIPPEHSKLDQIMRLSHDLLNDSDVQNIKLINFYLTKKPGMPDGIYLGAKIKDRDSNISWKIDIWALEPESLKENIKFTKNIKNKLTPELKELIIKWKYELMGDDDRVPQFGSYYLYKAILDENLRNKEEILAYLRYNNLVL